MVAQLFARAMQHHPQIALGNIKLLADFAVRALFDLVKLEYLGDAEVRALLFGRKWVKNLIRL